MPDTAPPDGFRDRRVLVTAGASGIGRAIAMAFLEAGARVHVCDVDAGALAQLAEEAPELGRSQADVSDEGTMTRFFEAALADLGGLDILVNNAGIAGPTAPLEAISLADWRATLAVNLDATFLCSRLAIPALRDAPDGAASIVNIASTAGLMGYPLRTPYAAAKWAVIGLTKSLAAELGPQGIRVNAICPGAIDGPRMDRVIAAEAAARGVSEAEVRAGYVGTTSLRTFIDAEEIAAMALFLCSAAGAAISGQAISVDGNTESLVPPR